MSVSRRATLTSFVGSSVFKPFSLNASITFHMSMRCTVARDKEERKWFELKFYDSLQTRPQKITHNLLPFVRIVACMRFCMKQIWCCQTTESASLEAQLFANQHPWLSWIISCCGRDDAWGGEDEDGKWVCEQTSEISWQINVWRWVGEDSNIRTCYDKNHNTNFACDFRCRLCLSFFLLINDDWNEWQQLAHFIVHSPDDIWSFLFFEQRKTQPKKIFQLSHLSSPCVWNCLQITTNLSSLIWIINTH